MSGKPKDAPNRAAKNMRTLRTKRKAAGKKQIAVYLSPEALAALDAKCSEIGLDRGKTLDAILCGHLPIKKPKKKKPSQPPDSQDIFDYNGN